MKTNYSGGKLRNTHAFTLIEMLAVLAIVMILLGLIAGVYTYIWGSTKRKKAEVELVQIRSTLDEYRDKAGSYPADADFTNATFTAMLPTNLKLDAQGRALDPWANPYAYKQLSPTSCQVFSEGPDKASGTAQTDADNVQ